MICPKLKDGNPPAGKVLLITQVFVANDEELETSCLSFLE